MEIFIAVFIFFLIITGLMAVGVLAGRKPIAGSCGGVPAALGEQDYECPICGDNPDNCIEQNDSGADGYSVSNASFSDSSFSNSSFSNSSFSNSAISYEAVLDKKTSNTKTSP